MSERPEEEVQTEAVDEDHTQHVSIRTPGSVEDEVAAAHGETLASGNFRDQPAEESDEVRMLHERLDVAHRELARAHQLGREGDIATASAEIRQLEQELGRASPASQAQAQAHIQGGEAELTPSPLDPDHPDHLPEGSQAAAADPDASTDKETQTTDTGPNPAPSASSRTRPRASDKD